MIEKLKYLLNATGNNLWQFRTRNLFSVTIICLSFLTVGIFMSLANNLRATAREDHLAMSGKKNMEINPASPLIKKLSRLRETDQAFARDITEQIYDNAMIQAGLPVDSQQMVGRSYRILERMPGAN